ncbi:Rieske 2Fe-2S domain-containing protein [Candidatus Binatia bacterium]|nr:Rieske 2Fe-2S domain-containing protein [Candidatus Binatia bacterium]
MCPTTEGPRGQRQPVVRVGELQPGETKKFLLACDGREEEAFVVNHDGRLYAYVNRCLHVPMTMDWTDNRFLTEDKRFILCATHGACYLPDTGECVAGPPCGKFLIRVPLTVCGDTVFANCPDPKELDR